MSDSTPEENSDVPSPEFNPEFEEANLSPRPIPIARIGNDEMVLCDDDILPRVGVVQFENTTFRIWDDDIARIPIPKWVADAGDKIGVRGLDEGINIQRTLDGQYMVTIYADTRNANEHEIQIDLKEYLDALIGTQEIIAPRMLNQLDDSYEEGKAYYTWLNASDAPTLAVFPDSSKNMSDDHLRVMCRNLLSGLSRYAQADVRDKHRSIRSNNSFERLVHSLIEGDNRFSLFFRELYHQGASQNNGGARSTLPASSVFNTGTTLEEITAGLRMIRDVMYPADETASNYSDIPTFSPIPIIESQEFTINGIPLTREILLSGAESFKIVDTQWVVAGGETSDLIYRLDNEGNLFHYADVPHKIASIAAINDNLLLFLDEDRVLRSIKPNQKEGESLVDTYFNDLSQIYALASFKDGAVFCGISRDDGENYLVTDDGEKYYYINSKRYQRITRLGDRIIIATERQKNRAISVSRNSEPKAVSLSTPIADSKLIGATVADGRAMFISDLMYSRRIGRGEGQFQIKPGKNIITTGASRDNLSIVFSAISIPDEAEEKSIRISSSGGIVCIAYSTTDSPDLENLQIHLINIDKFPTHGSGQNIVDLCAKEGITVSCMDNPKFFNSIPLQHNTKTIIHPKSDSPGVFYLYVGRGRITIDASTLV